jgi:hypothetical protein
MSLPAVACKCRTRLPRESRGTWQVGQGGRSLSSRCDHSSRSRSKATFLNEVGFQLADQFTGLDFDVQKRRLGMGGVPSRHFSNDFLDFLLLSGSRLSGSRLS